MLIICKVSNGSGNKERTVMKFLQATPFVILKNLYQLRVNKFQRNSNIINTVLSHFKEEFC